MFTTNAKISAAALAAALSLPLAAVPALAQDAAGEQAEQTDITEQAQQSAPEGTTVGDPMGAPQPDAIVAKVGDAEIRGAEVTTAIGMLPPQLQAQPPQMLVPIALEQLILRELILQEAEAQNLSDDPEVTRMVEQTVQDAEENAMVQVWLDRETAGSVSDDAVQSYYDEAKAQGGDDFPPLEEVRPQIEQHLRQQQMSELRDSLREGADIVFYDPAGNPVEEPAGGATATTSGSDMDADTSPAADGTDGQAAPDAPASEGTSESQQPG